MEASVEVELVAVVAGAELTINQGGLARLALSLRARALRLGRGDRASPAEKVAGHVASR
jgi:hypothetical protein